MTEPKHTPPPWMVEDRRGAPLKNIRVVAGDHQVSEVSDVHQRDYQGGFRGDHAAADAVDAIGLANAHLISAAPDLLAALRGFAATYVRDVPHDHRDYPLVMAARAAIAKAESRS